MRVGIFGGTFDPPHIGHLILASEARDQLELDQLLWVLTSHPPHKQDRFVTRLPLRLEMLQAALVEDPGFELSRLDIDRPPPHYAVDTARLVRQKFPTAQLVYIMGGDSLQDLPAWYQPQAFLQAIDCLGVMCRPGYQAGLAELERSLPGIGAKLRLLEAPLLEIASSEIRQRVREGRAYRYYLPPAVYRLVESRGLYQDSVTG